MDSSQNFLRENISIKPVTTAKIFVQNVDVHKIC